MTPENLIDGHLYQRRAVSEHLYTFILISSFDNRLYDYSLLQIFPVLCAKITSQWEVIDEHHVWYQFKEINTIIK